MIDQSNLEVPSFVSNAQQLTPIMHRLLSGGSNTKICISKSLNNKKFIIPIEEADCNCITVEGFFDMLDARMKEEFAYREEIMSLKDNLCTEYDKLCDGSIDEDFMKFVWEQRQRIIDVVISKTRIEKKMIAEKFFNDLNNGFEEQALSLNQFANFVRTVLWQPLLTPFPIKLLNEAKIRIKDLGSDKSKSKIQKITTQLVNYVRNHMETKKMKDSEFSTGESMRAALDEVAKARQICNIEVLDENKSQLIVKEFMNKCIKKVAGRIDLNYGRTGPIELSIIEFKLSYHELNLDYMLWTEAFDKLPKSTTKLSIRVQGEECFQGLGKNITISSSLNSLYVRFRIFEIDQVRASLSVIQEMKNLSNLSLDYGCYDSGKLEEEGAKVLSLSLINFRNISVLKLDLYNNQIRATGAIALSAALKELNQISTLDLNLSYNNIGVEGIKSISDVFTRFSIISVLRLNLSRNKIEAEGAKLLSASLKNLFSISVLDLQLKSNNIRNKGTTALCASLKELINISDLTLNLQKNFIYNDGGNAISDVLKELRNLSKLSLNLWKNRIGAEGAVAMSTGLSELDLSFLNLNLQSNGIGENGSIALFSSLKEMKHISCLNMNMSWNYIGDEGAKSLSDTLKNMHLISTLKLDLSNENIGDSGAKAVSTALKDLANINCLDLNFSHNNIGNEGAKAMASSIQQLKSYISLASLILNFEFNETSNEGAKTIISALKESNISKLTLNFWANKIEEDGISTFDELRRAHPNYNTCTQ